jgi:hypothetical protein
MSDTPTRYRKVSTSSLSFTATVSTRQRNYPICWRPWSHSPRMRYSGADRSCEAHLNGGGMPLSKLIGDRFLNWAQNTFTGVRPSEWQGRHRPYRIPRLTSVRYGVNSHDYGCAKQIIVQLLNTGARITRLAIPTHLGDEIYRAVGFTRAPK